MKILYYFCGEGLGHTTRTLAAASELTKNHEVAFASYGYAKAFLEKNGFPCIEVPSELKLVGKAGALDIKDSVLTTIKKTNPASLLKHATILHQVKPELVITDSFYIPAILAKTKHIPVWMILNQTNVEKFFSEHGESIRWIGNAVKKINQNTLVKNVDKILIPDFAPPYTIAAKNLAFTPAMIEKVEYLGPLVRKNQSDLKLKEKPKTVFASIGGFGYRKQLLEKLIHVAQSLSRYHFELVCGPNSDTHTTQSNVTLHGTVLNPLPLMARASLIICGGGHSTIMESICLGKPVLSMPDLFHFEQESNASQLQELGLGSRIDYKTPEPILEELITRYATDKTVKQKLARMAKLAEKLDGKKKLLQLVQEHQTKK